jgi:hypothetical protein
MSIFSYNTCKPKRGSKKRNVNTDSGESLYEYNKDNKNVKIPVINIFE